MRLFGRRPHVAAFVCSRGVFAIVGKRSSSGFEIDRVLDAPASLETEEAAADHLVTVLRSETIANASLTVALRGFGVVHHMLSLPPAKDDLLRPIIERELRRLEPELADAVIAWTPLPSLESAAESPPQRSILVAAAPGATVATFEQRLRAAGHRTAHITALPVAMQRLVEEFDETGGAVALVAPLPDGAFMGFVIGGAVRIVVEPPLPRGAGHESAALAEELELGAMFVRQQFRGAHLDRIALVGTTASLADVEAVLADKVHVPAKQLGGGDLSPAAFAALGSLLDAQSPKPLSLGGDSRGGSMSAASSAIQSAGIAALFIFALTGLWTITETVRSQRAATALRTARMRVQQDSFGLAPVRATADQRRLVRDAVAAARVVATDRIALQEALAGIAAAAQTGTPVRLDSLRLDRSDRGWKVVLEGSAIGATNADAIQSLHDMYRELPQRLPTDSLHLDELSYADSGATTTGSKLVRFQFSFDVTSKRRN